MLGFIFGTVCLVALFKVLRHGRHGWRYAHGCGHGGGWRSSPRCAAGAAADDSWGPRGGWRGGFGEGFMLRGLFSRLETTPGQEKVIRDALDKVRETMREARAEWQDTSSSSTLAPRRHVRPHRGRRRRAAKADASFAKVRVVIVEALAQIHEALDDRQRRILAELHRVARSRWVRSLRWHTCRSRSQRQRRKVGVTCAAES